VTSLFIVGFAVRWFLITNTILLSWFFLKCPFCVLLGTLWSYFFPTIDNFSIYFNRHIDCSSFPVPSTVRFEKHSCVRWSSWQLPVPRVPRLPFRVQWPPLKATLQATICLPICALYLCNCELCVRQTTKDKRQTTDTGHRTFTIQHPAFSRWNIESGGKAF